MARPAAGKPPARRRRRESLPAVGAAKIDVRLSRPGREQCERISPQRISDVLDDPGVVLWVDIAGPDEQTLALLREEFGFHRLALEDVIHGRQRPKVDEYPGYFFVVLYAPAGAPAGPGIDVEEIRLFVGRNYVVTVADRENAALARALSRWDETDVELRGHPGFLLHVIADEIIDSYFPIVETLEDRLDEFERAVFQEGGAFDPQALLLIKRTLYTLRKAVFPMREVFNEFLRRDGSPFGSETNPYFQDAYDHVLRLLDLIDIERDMATGALEAQLSVVSNRLNETMKRLTVVAICVALLGAVFGAWGMNFTHVPLGELGLTGFLLVSGGALALVAVTLYLARRSGFW